MRRYRSSNHKGFFQIKYATFFYRHVFDKVFKITQAKSILSFHFCDSVLIKELTKVGYHLEVIFDRDDIGHPNRQIFCNLATISSVFFLVTNNDIRLQQSNFLDMHFLVPPTIFLTDLK
jgi:hypothetical protein